MTGYGSAAAARREWASMLRLLFDAHTVQNLSLKDALGGGPVAASWSVESTAPSSCVATSGSSSTGGGGGGGGG